MSRLPPICADQFTVRPDRSVWSNRYERVVHDSYPVGELIAARLLAGSGPPWGPSTQSAGQNRSPQILLLGFGIGTDLLSIIESLGSAKSLTGISSLAITLYERFPPNPVELRKLWGALGIESALSRELIAQWPAPSGGMHRLLLPLSQPGQCSVELTLVYGDAERSLVELSGPFDWVIFSKTAGGLSLQPGSRTGLGQLRRLSHVQTWVVGPPNTDHVLTPLQQLGLDARIDTSGWLGSWRGFKLSNRRSNGQSNHGVTRADQRQPRTTAIVLGAGIAGLSVARELSGTGLDVTVLEQRDEALLGGSAQPILAGHLHFSSDDNPLARLTRAAQALQPRLNLTVPVGRLQLLSNSDAAAAARLMLEQLALPAELVRMVNAGEASELAGLDIAKPALWQSSTHALSPSRLRSDLPAKITLKTSIVIHRMHRDRDEWVLLDQQDMVIARAPTVVLCTGSIPPGGNATGGSDDLLVPAHSIQTSIVAGQTTHLSDRLSGKLRCIIGGDNYACPLPDGSVLTGASYRPVPTGLNGLPVARNVALTDEDRQANIDGWHRLTRTEPASANPQIRVIGDYSGLRYTTPDHLPLIGPVVDEHAVRHHWEALHRDDRLTLPLLPGIFMAGGFGSRGVLWSALASAVLRDLITGAQPPIERSLIAAIAPHRFLRKAIRRFSHAGCL